MCPRLLCYSLLVVVGLAACAGAAPTVETFLINEPRAADAAATYLIVCPEKAVEAIVPLAQRRSDGGQTVRIATLERINRVYGDEPSPAARVRAMVDAVRKLGGEKTPLRFLLLVGTADGGNTEGMALPTFSYPARYWTREFPAERTLRGDYLYGLPPGTSAPDVAVGRLPARSLDEVKTMVAKTLRADGAGRSGAWRREVSLIAGQGNYGPLADKLLETLFAAVVSGAVPDYLNLRVSYGNPASPYCWPPNRFRRHVVEELNAGPAVLAYVGHGYAQGLSTITWRGRRWDMFESADAVEAVNPDHRTVVVSICCSTGLIDGPVPSIGERLVASPTGPAAFIGSSGISQPYGNAVLAELIVEALVAAPRPTVGEAMLDVRRSLAAHKVTPLRGAVDLMAATQLGLAALPQQRVDQLTLYNLLGDPALPLGVVRPTARIEAPAEAQPGEAITLRMASDAVPEGAARWRLSVRRNYMKETVQPVKEDDPQAEEKMVRAHAAANDKTLASGETKIGGGRAEWTVRLPETCPGDVVAVSVVAESAEGDAAACATIAIRRPSAEK